MWSVWQQVRGAATRALQSVDAENLPIVLKFLLKTATAAELPEVGATFRERERERERENLIKRKRKMKGETEDTQ